MTTARLTKRVPYLKFSLMSTTSLFCVSYLTLTLFMLVLSTMVPVCYHLCPEDVEVWAFLPTATMRQCIFHWMRRYMCKYDFCIQCVARNWIPITFAC